MHTSTKESKTSEAIRPDQRGERFNALAVGTVSASHFVHDLYPSFVGPLLPLLIEKHGMTMAIAGGLASIIRLPSIAQPFFGYLADRYDARLLVVFPPLVTAMAISLLGPSPNYLTLVILLLVGGVSSATFHPAAAAMVTRAAGREWGRASSYFMTGGELGRALGPAYIVMLIAAVGLGNLWVAVLPAVAVTALSYFQVGSGTSLARPPIPSGLRAALAAEWRSLLLLSGVILFRALVIASFQTFYVAYLTSIGAALVFAGMALTVYEVGGVAGAFLGGPLSDRLGRRTMLAISQVAAGPVLFAALMLPEHPVGLALLALGGLLALSAGPVQLTLAQELMPRNRSAAAGIMMFLGFEGNVLATIAIGFIADVVGLGTALTWSILTSMLSLPFTLLLPETRVQPVAKPESRS